MLVELSFHENAENSAIWAMVNRPGVLDDDLQHFNFLTEQIFY